MPPSPTIHWLYFYTITRAITIYNLSCNHIWSPVLLYNQVNIIQCWTKQHWNYPLSGTSIRSSCPPRILFLASRSNRLAFLPFYQLFGVRHIWTMTSAFLGVSHYRFYSLTLFAFIPAPIVSKLPIVPSMKSGSLLCSDVLLRALGPPSTTQTDCSSRSAVQSQGHLGLLYVVILALPFTAPSWIGLLWPRISCFPLIWFS